MFWANGELMWNSSVKWWTANQKKIEEISKVSFFLSENDICVEKLI